MRYKRIESGTYAQALLVKQHLQIVRQLRRAHESDGKLHEFQIMKMKNCAKRCSCSLGKVYVPAHVGVSATENEVLKVR